MAPKNAPSSRGETRLSKSTGIASVLIERAPSCFPRCGQFPETHTHIGRAQAPASLAPSVSAADFRRNDPVVQYAQEVPPLHTAIHPAERGEHVCSRSPEGPKVLLLLRYAPDHRSRTRNCSHTRAYFRRSP